MWNIPQNWKHYFPREHGAFSKAFTPKQVHISKKVYVHKCLAVCNCGLLYLFRKFVFQQEAVLIENISLLSHWGKKQKMIGLLPKSNLMEDLQQKSMQVFSLLGKHMPYLFMCIMLATKICYKYIYIYIHREYVSISHIFRGLNYLKCWQ